MTITEMNNLERRLNELFEHHVTELQKNFVTKADFVHMVARVEKHEEAYKDYIQGKKWILRLGIATLLSAALSPHLAAIVRLIKEIF